MKTKFNQSQDFISIVIMKIFNLIAEYEKKIEIIRRVISDNSQFDISSVFQFFDKNKRNSISINDIIHFLESKSMFCDFESVKLFISFYDTDRSGNLNFDEFKNVLISSKDPSLKSYSNKKLNTNYIIPSELLHLMVRLFITEIQFANKLLD
jgi:Ca2+-binding EF-hand superfamily protein